MSNFNTKINMITKRRILLVLCDSISIYLASYIALVLRFDNHIPEQYALRFKIIIIPAIICGICMFYLWKLYSSLWKFASTIEMKNIVLATFTFSLLYTLMCVISNNTMPKSTYFIFFLLLVVFVGGLRFSYRLSRNYIKRYTSSSKDQKKVMIIGAGNAGEGILKDFLHSSFVQKKVMCFIDDNTKKWNRTLHDIPIVGGRHDIEYAVKKYQIDEIIVAIPSAPEKEVANILTICSHTNCTLKRLPGIFQLINGEVSISKLREVEIKDLLGRESIQVNLSDIMDYVKGKVVMVTGGGGSIGSELCRQIASNKPKQLIIIDIYENNAYDIQQELAHKYPGLDLKVRIASVRDTKKIDALFHEFHPNLVYHAAAHKHVPLMEDSPNEAVKNNVFGTLNVVKASDRYHVDKFIMISTDKAVNPTNIMGATKRICEMIISIYNRQSKTDYVAVRFGNVLGSNGSVIPLFKKQIAYGGPVKVTHPDIIRYFMTIQEAVSLVLQAGAFANGGEIFVLDMGEPIKIADMARNLISLSGYIPDVDIKIVYTGLRPGEKLYEEMLMEEEGLQTTPNKMIHIGKPLELEAEQFFLKLEKLHEIVLSESKQTNKMIKELVDTYHYDEMMG